MKKKYPLLELEMFKRDVKGSDIARRLGISERALHNKRTGRTVFTWPEACAIHDAFFADVDKNELFRPSDDTHPHDKRVG